jgi:putative transposase
MVAFIDDHRAEYGVEPICRVLPIAPSTYYTRKTIEADPTKASARAQRSRNPRPAGQRVNPETPSPAKRQFSKYIAENKNRS